MDVKALLEVQKIDTQIDQAQHALEHLAQRAEHVRSQETLSLVRSQRDDVRREQQAQESELANIELQSTDIDTRKRRLEAQLKTVIAPREAEALQHEIATLDVERSALDDRGIELLEASSRADESLTSLGHREIDAVAAEAAARDDLQRAVAAMEHELERLRARRAEVGAQISVSDLEEYESRRSTSGGVAITQVVKGVCGGCHMDISISELDAIKRLPPDAIAECPNCMRILVR